jgi:hypothetical protein
MQWWETEPRLTAETAEAQGSKAAGPASFKGNWNALAGIGFYANPKKVATDKKAPKNPEANAMFQRRAEPLWDVVGGLAGWEFPHGHAAGQLPVRAKADLVLKPPPGGALLCCKECKAPLVIGAEWEGLENLGLHFRQNNQWQKPTSCKVEATMSAARKQRATKEQKQQEQGGAKKKKGGDVCNPFTLSCPWCPLEYHGNRRSHRGYIFGALKTHGERDHGKALSLMDVREDVPAAEVFAQDAKAATAGCDALQDVFLLSWNVASAVKNLVALTRLMESLVQTGCQFAGGLIEAGASKHVKTLAFSNGIQARFRNEPVKGCHSGEILLDAGGTVLENAFPGIYMLSDLKEGMEELGVGDRRCASWLGATFQALAPDDAQVTILTAVAHLPVAGKAGWREGLKAVLDAVDAMVAAKDAKLALLYCDTNCPLPGRLGARGNDDEKFLKEETERLGREYTAVHPDAATHRGGRNIDCCFVKGSIEGVSAKVRALSVLPVGEGSDHAPMVWKVSGLRRLPPKVVPNPRSSEVFKQIDARGVCWDKVVSAMERECDRLTKCKKFLKIAGGAGWQKQFPPVKEGIATLEAAAGQIFGGMRAAMLQAGAKVIKARDPDKVSAHGPDEGGSMPPMELLKELYGEEIDEDGAASLSERGEIGGGKFWARLKNRKHLIATGKQGMGIRHEGGIVNDPASLLDLALKQLVEDKEAEVRELPPPPEDPQKFAPGWGTKSPRYDDPPCDCTPSEVTCSLKSARSVGAKDAYGVTLGMWQEVCERSAKTVKVIALWNTAYFRLCYMDADGDSPIIPPNLNVCLMTLIEKAAKPSYAMLLAWRIVGSPPVGRIITDGIMARRWQVLLRHLGPQNTGFESKTCIVNGFILAAVTTEHQAHQAVTNGEGRQPFVLMVMDIANAFPNQLPEQSRVATAAVGSKWQARASHDAKLRKTCRLRIANRTADATSSIGNSQGTRIGPIDWRVFFNSISEIENHPLVKAFLKAFGGADDSGGFIGPCERLGTLIFRTRKCAELFGEVCRLLGCVLSKEKCFWGVAGEAIDCEAVTALLEESLTMGGALMNPWPSAGHKVLGILVQLRDGGLCVKEHIKSKCLQQNVNYARASAREYSASPWWSFGKSVVVWNVVMSRFRYGGPLISRQWAEAKQENRALWGKLTSLMRTTFSAPPALEWEAVELLCKLPKASEVLVASECDLLVYLARVCWLHRDSERKRLDLEAAKWAFKETYDSLVSLLQWRAPERPDSDEDSSEAGLDPLVQLLDHDFEYWSTDLVRAPIDQFLRCSPFPATRLKARDILGKRRERRSYARDTISAVVQQGGSRGVIIIFVDGGHKVGLAGAACAVFYWFGPDGERERLLTITTLASNKSDSWVEEGHAAGLASRTLKRVVAAKSGTAVPEDHRALWRKIRQCRKVGIGQDCTGWITLAGNLVKRTRPNWPTSGRFQRDLLETWQANGLLEIEYFYYPGHVWEVAPGEVKDLGRKRGVNAQHLDALESAFRADRTAVHEWENASAFVLPTKLKQWADGLGGTRQLDATSLKVLHGLEIEEWLDLSRAVRDAMEAARDPHGHRHCDDCCTAAIAAGKGVPFENRSISGKSLNSWFLLGVRDHVGELKKLVATKWGIPAGEYAFMFAGTKDFSLTPELFTNYSPLNRLLWCLFFNLPVAPGGDAECSHEGCGARPTLLHLIKAGHLGGDDLKKLLRPLGLDWENKPLRSAAALFLALKEDCSPGESGKASYVIALAVNREYKLWGDDLEGVIKRPWIACYDKGQFNRIVVNYRNGIAGASYKDYVTAHLLDRVDLGEDGTLEAHLQEELGEEGDAGEPAMPSSEPPLEHDEGVNP